jgi:hypothetical protein
MLGAGAGPVAAAKTIRACDPRFRRNDNQLNLVFPG